VDIAIELLPKVADEAEFRKWCDGRRYAAREQGKNIRSSFDWIFWPRVEIFETLRSRSRTLSLHGIDDLAEMVDVRYRVLRGDPARVAALTLNHLQRLTSCGVHWRSFTEQYLDSTGIFREAVIGILAAVAKQERVRISERVQAGLARARKQGRIGGRPKAEDDHKLVQAVQRLRAAGKSIRQIAAEADISTNTVLKLLRAAEAEAA
jgi:DNA-binding CsgD family transcriptional regulator